MKNAGMIIGVVVLFLLFAAITSAESSVRIGVLADRGGNQAILQWKATGKYLSEELKRDIRIVPLKFDEVEAVLKKKEVEFLLANSAFYTLYQEKYKLKAVTTLVNKKGVYGLDQYGSVLFVRKDSKIKKIKDIRWKRFMCVNSFSFGGGQMALRMLKENDIDPERQCSAFMEGETHDEVVMAVLNGKADMGAVRTDILERMMEEGRITMDSFRIIDQVKDGFPFVHSSALYPEWPFAACQTTDEDLVRDVTKALMLLKSTHQAMIDANIYSWTYPADYSEVAACLRITGALEN